jgi:hypothetical protein
MMKQFAFLWCLVAAASVGAADHVASVNLEVDDPAVEVEELVDVRVMVSTTAPVNVVELRLEYDPTFLRPLAVDCDGGAFTFDGLIDLDSVPGVVHVIRGEPHGTAPKGDDLDVCAVQFLARLATAATEVRVRPAADGGKGSSVFLDDGVPTDALTQGASATFEITGQPAPRLPDGRADP